MATSTSTSKITTSTTLLRFYKVLIEQPMDATQLQAEAQRIDNGVTTLSEMLKNIFESPSRSAGRADELAEAFFVLFGRAPDPTTFGACMDLLRAGKSLGALIDMALAAPGYQLSNSGYSSHTSFLNKAYEVLTGGLLLDSGVADELATMLASGQTTRGQLIANALESHLPLFHANRLPMVKTALLYLAAADQEASAANLASATGDVRKDILAALNSGGGTLTGVIPYFIKQSASGADVKVNGTADADLVVNLQSNITTLGGASNFKAQYSINGGFDASQVSFAAGNLQGVTTFDASSLTGKGKLSFVGNSVGGNYNITAPGAGSLTLQGGNGSDRLNGGVGSDRLVATAGTDTLSGGAGDDVFVIAKLTAYTGGGYTRISDFGDGADTIDFSQLLGGASPKSESLNRLPKNTVMPSAIPC